MIDAPVAHRRGFKGIQEDEIIQQQHPREQAFNRRAEETAAVADQADLSD